MKITWSSDCDLAGSGYWTLTSNIASRLHAKGHQIVVLGNDYKGEPHDFRFTLAPSTMRELRSQVEAIKQSQWPDVLVLSWDIPAQKQLTDWFANKGTALCVGLFPVEAGPLREIDEWVGYIRSMDLAFVISEFGLQQCQDAGLTNVTFLPVGIDSSFWHPPATEYRDDLRRDLGLEGKFVVITVGDNHFRKNLSAGIETIAKLRDTVPNVEYILVARPHPRSIGWSLKELAARYHVEDCVRVVHSRPSNDMLLRFYQASDAYLCTSHAEGLGLPILEAMACGVPVVSGDWTAMGELIADGRGLAVPFEYTFCDPFGNNVRHFIDTDIAARQLERLYRDHALANCIREKALEFARSRNFDLASRVFIDGIYRAAPYLRPSPVAPTPPTPVAPTLGVREDATRRDAVLVRT